MAWLKIETAVARNRKFIKAGPAPAWLWLCGIAYSQEGLTDGFIPDEAIEFLGVKKNARGMATRLVDAGLWEVVEGGWHIHDYLDHNRSADHVRGLTNKRQAAGQMGGRPRKEKQTEKQNEIPVKARSGDYVNLTENPDQIRSDQQQSRSATATTPRPSAPLHPPRNLNAVFVGGRGLDVLTTQHRRFVARLNTPEAEKVLFEWYLAVSEEWTYGARKADNVGADVCKFWDLRFDERWPATGAKDTRPAWARGVKP